MTTILDARARADTALLTTAQFMKSTALKRILSTIALCLSGVACVSAASFTQRLTLDSGWNAIWLEVEPRYSSGTNINSAMSVEDVFSDPAIAIVATPQNAAGTAEFITDAETTRFNQAGWRVWRRDSELRVDSLAVVNGGRGYLVYVSAGSAVTLNVQGKVSPSLPIWNADSYNLIGFGLLGPVSFNSFFASSNGRHPINKIFRLQADGNWAGVRGSDMIEPGRAYWIYSEGASSFCGPVKVSFDGSDSLAFGAGPGDVSVPDPQSVNGGTMQVTLRELVFSDVSGANQAVTVRKITPETTGTGAMSDELRLYEVAPGTNQLSYTLGPNGQVVAAAFSVPANSTRIATLGAYRAWSTGAKERENLYRIEFAYNYLWLPVTAASADLSDAVTNAANPNYGGLWVGEVGLNQVSSITEAGSPLKPSTSTAPMRIIIHVDANGNASLLSHVMFMQSKTADPTVKAEEVLVVDEAKIPFFEGIETRGGQKVGKRIETTSYDLPRETDTETQAALVSASAAALGIDTSALTEADIRTYLNGQATRPPALVEKYYRSWALIGGFSPGALITSTLTMDPFHRSNPFRHAYHPKHGTGYAITRNLTLRLDAKYEAGVLAGTYEETITGLAAMPLKTKGSITLRKLSEVTTLQ